MPPISLTPDQTLPKDAGDATLLGRVWLPEVAGPAIVTLRGDALVDVTSSFPTRKSVV